jgi:serine/threonine-protein kinase
VRTADETLGTQRKQQAQPDKPPTSTGKKVAIAAGCAALSGCPGAQVRPPPEDCPPTAITAMKQLEIRRGTLGDVQEVNAHRTEPMTVRAGPATLELFAPLGKLPEGTLLKGQLFIGKEYVYGRFTEAQVATSGEHFPICLQLWDLNRRDVGVKIEGREGPGTAKITNFLMVEVVHRFE